MMFQLTCGYEYRCSRYEIYFLCYVYKAEDTSRGCTYKVSTQTRGAKATQRGSDYVRRGYIVSTEEDGQGRAGGCERQTISR